MARVSNKEAGPKIAAREDFTTYTGSFRGANVGAAQIIYPLGRLTAEAIVAIDKATTDYVVWSYETPIAWHSSEDGWHVAAVTYSGTTSRHQGIVRRAVL